MTGGIDLASEWAGFTSVGQCEFADYPTKVLEKHWPNVPRWRDIRDVTLESVRDRGIRSIDLISGGFPCQPFSVAGKQRGKEDDRYLWPEMLRVIEELRPTWVVGENVTGIVKMELDQVLSDLESKGYTAIPFAIPAASVNAPHRRERIFILAHADSIRRDMREPDGKGVQGGEQTCNETDSSCKNVADTYGELPPEPGNTRTRRPESSDRGISGRYWHDPHHWESEPNVDRVVNGVSNELYGGIKDRVDRLKCLGNAVVPQQVYPILQAIADIERGLS